MKLEFKKINLNEWKRAPYANPTQFFPVIQAGKFKKIEDKVMMPFSITVHHGVVDGYQVSEYLEALQKAMNTPENWAK